MTLVAGEVNRQKLSASVDVVIVGAGFAGMYMVHKCHELGLSCLAIEKGDDVGGTWYWNRYPGARCDVPSLEYSYQFSEELQREWHWSEKYATQPEILRYAQHVAERFDLKRDMVFETTVTHAAWNDDTSSWCVDTDRGDTVHAQFLVMATGCLSSANKPRFPDDETFRGEVYHTGSWPHDGVDFTGKRVAVIGTGSSGLQSIPLIAEQASHLTVFQRTATYSVPANNGPNDADYEAKVMADIAGFRARNSATRSAFGGDFPTNEVSVFDVDDDERHRMLEERWDSSGLLFLGAFNDVLMSDTSNEAVAEFVREKIRGIVKDPVVAEKLAPRQTIGCKRLCLDTNYYGTFNRDNVTLVDISDAPIDRLTPNGVVTGGVEYEVDVIVYATGFDAMTGSFLKANIHGRGGLPLTEAWGAGPLTYLGLNSHGFPNMFLVTGPGSPSVLTNMIVSIEQHVNWIGECISHMRNNGHRIIEAQEQAQADWVAYVNMIAGYTLFPTCNSWYLGANVPGKPRVFMPLLGYSDYVARCEQVAATGYAGFQLSA
ncbi:MAG: NAD(P)/FAD-dependent oxidoreductase [Actinobacteria bacterium]|nr:NAD(P)/FAD-dependent oxidoreductase [Actinomycetota bacterium]